ncbi:MAG: hypothetical protein GKR95_18695 [Gammaproteobacteria bacterium]|nr:hypothetical protein [Gammaproteobacteria bacterium]
MSNFKLNSDFVLILDDKPVDRVQIFHSKKAAAYLIVAPALSTPLLVNFRSNDVKSVHLTKITYHGSSGSVDLLADAIIKQVSQFSLNNQAITFKIGDETAKLKQAPPVLGEVSGADIKKAKPDFTFKARTYEIDKAILATLKGESREVRVRTYFGTWCPPCVRLVPRLLKLEDALSGSRIHFEYYGLPKPISADLESKKVGIKEVPVAVVYIGKREVGRIQGSRLQNPEAIIRSVLEGA